MAFTVTLYRESFKFPNDERFGLTAHVRRAVVISHYILLRAQVVIATKIFVDFSILHFGKATKP
jgi:hypothetical protein